jgi:hypothetical protein
MAPEVSRWPLTAEAQVHSRVSPCVIFGRQSGTETGFSESFSVFTCQYHYIIRICHRPMKCAISLTKQHIVIPSVLS